MTAHRHVGKERKSALLPHTHTPIPTHGLYNLLLHLQQAHVISVGRLGEFAFPAGYYVYTGSAMGGLDARIQRHLRQEKRLRWHIDYLLQVAEVVKVHRHPIDASIPRITCVPRTKRVERLECLLSNAILKLPGAIVIAHGFGSSDCQCVAHLAYFASRPAKLKRLRIADCQS